MGLPLWMLQLTALLGLVGLLVGFFVTRVEHVQLEKRVDALENLVHKQFLSMLEQQHQ